MNNYFIISGASGSGKTAIMSALAKQGFSTVLEPAREILEEQRAIEGDKASEQFRYNNKVFFVPSWEAIYTNDEERRISFAEAKQFGDNLKQIYESLSYEIIEIPCISPEERAEFILSEVQIHAISVTTWIQIIIATTHSAWYHLIAMHEMAVASLNLPTQYLLAGYQRLQTGPQKIKEYFALLWADCFLAYIQALKADRGSTQSLLYLDSYLVI